MDKQQDMGASADADRATRASTEPATRLGPDGRVSHSADDWVEFELYEVGRGWPDLMVASVGGPREQALREIQHYAMMYSQDGPVSIREVEQP